MNAAGWTSFSAPHGAIRAFVVPPPAEPPWPALLVLHAVNGAGPHMEAKARAFADEGYLAVVPDIYSLDPHFAGLDPDDVLAAAHIGPDPSRWPERLATFEAARRPAIERARAWQDRRPASTYIEIVAAAFAWLAERDDVGVIGALGYCMGGRLVGELAARGVDLAAGVIYYGAPPPLDRAHAIRAALQGHYASRDTPITSKVPAFAEAMHAAGKDFTAFVYEADHGFSIAPGTRDYDEAATALSLQRARPFLAAHLRGATPSRAARSR